MRAHERMIGSVVLALTLGCGSSEVAKAPADVPPPAPAAPAAPAADPSAAQMAQGMQQAAEGMAAMMAGMQQQAANRPVVDPLSFRDLYPVFPQVEGWQQGKPTGQSVNMPFKVSQAEVKYTNGSGGGLKVTILDGGWNPMMLAPYTMFLKAGYERETETGYEKSVSMAGQVGWEKWDDRRKDGQINLVVSDRFLVQFEGDDVASVDTVRDFVNRSNLTILTTAAANAQPAAAPPPAQP